MRPHQNPQLSPFPAGRRHHAPPPKASPSPPLRLPHTPLPPARPPVHRRRGLLVPESLRRGGLPRHHLRPHPGGSRKGHQMLLPLEIPRQRRRRARFLTGPALGLSKADIALFVTKDPRILNSRVDNNLRARLDGFRSHGFSTAQIRSFVRASPCGFRTFNIDEKLGFWMSFFGSPDKLLRIIRRNYYLIYSDLDKVVKANIRLLQERGLSVQDIDSLCVANPRLLICYPDVTRAVLVRADELGVPRNSFMFRQAVKTAAGLAPEKMASKLKMMRKMLGCSDAEFASMVRMNPLVLTSSMEKLQCVYEFLTKVVGLDAKYIQGRPTILMYNLERRLAPRNYVMKP